MLVDNVGTEMAFVCARMLRVEAVHLQRGAMDGRLSDQQEWGPSPALNGSKKHTLVTTSVPCSPSMFAITLAFQSMMTQ